MEGGKRRLGDMLVEMNLVRPEEIEQALAVGREKGLRLGESLIELGLLTEDQILWTLAQQMGLSFIRVTDDQVLPEVVRLVPEEMARRHRILPLLRIGNELTLAVNDPLDDNLFADVARLIGGEVRICLAKVSEILAALDQVYGASAAPAAGQVRISSPRYSKAELKEFVADKRGMKLLLRLAADALGENVDKIHLDVRGEEAVVRFRREGSLQEVLRMPAETGRSLLTRLAILGKAAEGGASFRVQLPLPEQIVALEVHVQKVLSGEIAALRLLGKRAREMPLPKLGLTPAQRNAVEAILATPGVVAVTGPANSGRATTVMSLLGRFDPAGHRILTVEDWVRTTHPGYTQVLRQPGTAAGIDNLLLLDPDVIYLETLASPAEIETAWRAGMAGTFIFTLFGFRRVPSVLVYLSGIGLPPALMAEGLSGIIAEHLLRRLCEKCKTRLKPKKGLFSALPDKIKEELSTADLYQPKGCKACAGTGFSGRAAVFEVLAVDQELRAAFSAGLSEADLPLISKKIGELLPERVLTKIKAGECVWTELLAFR